MTTTKVSYASLFFHNKIKNGHNCYISGFLLRSSLLNQFVIDNHKHYIGSSKRTRDKNIDILDYNFDG